MTLAYGDCYLLAAAAAVQREESPASSAASLVPRDSLPHPRLEVLAKSQQHHDITATTIAEPQPSVDSSETWCCDFKRGISLSPHI